MHCRGHRKPLLEVSINNGTSHRTKARSGAAIDESGSAMDDSMTHMHFTEAPTWVTVFGWIYTGAGLLFAAWILTDTYAGGFRQRVRAMEIVWPITAIWSGPLGLWAYYRWGRPATAKWQSTHGGPTELSMPARVAVETIPGGAASFVGHAIAVPIVGLTGLTIAGEHVWPMIILIAVFALPLLIGFEYHALTVTIGQQASVGKRLRVAAVISVLAVLAFDLGMGATMLLVAFVLGYSHATIAFWLLMWGGIMLGFITAYPMVWWLLARNTPQSVLEPTKAR